MSLFAEQNDLQYAVPGGLIGIGTKIDPTLTRADRLVGQVVGALHWLPAFLLHYPEVWSHRSVTHRLHGTDT